MAKIMIIESSQQVIERLKSFLIKDNHEVFLFDNSEPIEDILSQIKFDAILIDLQYDKSNCLDLVQKIAKNDINSGTHIIAMTNKADKDLLNRYNAVGVSYLFMKPFRYKLLAKKIDHILNPKNNGEGAFDPVILKIFLESTIHIFENVGNIPILAGKPFLKSHTKSLEEIVAVIGLSSSQIKGSMSITVNRDVLSRILFKLLGPTAHTNDDDLQDICGEMCNQILGRAKQQFLKKKNMSFEITIPTVLVGKERILDYKLQAPILVIPFIFEKKECVFIEFCLELNDSYEPIAPEKLQVVVEEGTFIQF